MPWIDGEFRPVSPCTWRCSRGALNIGHGTDVFSMHVEMSLLFGSSE